MKKLIILISAATLFFNFSKPIADSWDDATIQKANTAKDVAYMSDEEKKVVLYTNLVRLKPDLFSKTYLQKFLDSTKTKSSSFVNSLKNDLTSRFKPVDILMPKEDLATEAKDHATDTGNKGNLGHFTSDGKSFDWRIKKFKNSYSSISENCDYGNNTALAIIVHLLIDEGQGTGEHRKTIMDKNLKYVGVSIQPHKKEKWTCVMDFANDKK